MTRASELMAAASRHDEAVISRLTEGVLHMEESSTYQAIIRKGEIKRGRDDLLRLGQRRFGPPPADVERTVLSIDDPERLAKLLDGVLDLKQAYRSSF